MWLEPRNIQIPKRGSSDIIRTTSKRFSTVKTALVLATVLTFAPLVEKAVSVKDVEAAQRKKCWCPTAEEKNSYIRDYKNAEEVELSCLSRFYLKEISTKSQTINARDFYNSEVVTYKNMMTVKLFHKGGTITFNEKTISDRDGKCGFSAKLEQELNNPNVCEKEATFNAGRFAMNYIMKLVEKSRIVYYGAWAAGAFLIPAALYGVFSAIKKIRGVRMTKKKEDLEKLGDEYKKKLEPYLDKFWEAKTLEELYLLRDKQWAIVEEIQGADKKLGGKLMPRLQPLLHELQLMYFDAQNRLGGPKIDV